MARFNYEISICIKSNYYASATLKVFDSGKDTFECMSRLTKDDLYNFLSLHFPYFRRNAGPARQYSFHELCHFLILHQKSSYFPFNLFVYADE